LAGALFSSGMSSICLFSSESNNFTNSTSLIDDLIPRSSFMRWYISYLIPFTYFVEIIRGLLIKQTLFIDLFVSYIALFSFAVVFIIISISKFRKTL